MAARFTMQGIKELSVTNENLGKAILSTKNVDLLPKLVAVMGVYVSLNLFSKEQLKQLNSKGYWMENSPEEYLKWVITSDRNELTLLYCLEVYKYTQQMIENYEWMYLVGLPQVDDYPEHAASKY